MPNAGAERSLRTEGTRLRNISCVARFDPLENAGTFFEATYLTATAATAFRFGELPPDSSIQD